MDKVIISVAPVAGTDSLIPEELVTDVEKCVDAGASMCHLHCKTRDGILTPDISNMSLAFDKILEKRDIIVQASTGGISKMTIEERCKPLWYHRAESASLNGGSTNLGEAIYRNSLDDIRYCAKVCYERRILPEIEVFDIGMIHNIERIRKEIPFQEPLAFNLVFGHKGGMQPTMQALSAFQSFLPMNSFFGVTHYARDNWSFLAGAIAVGARLIRIGFEDSRYLTNKRMARYNYELVEKLAALIHAMDMEVATPMEARKILGI